MSHNFCARNLPDAEQVTALVDEFGDRAPQRYRFEPSDEIDHVRLLTEIDHPQLRVGQLSEMLHNGGFS